MPLKKLTLKAGVNKENTRYTAENGWYVSDKMRFRQGTPEKIGGWVRISASIFQGVCRSLWNWVTLSSLNLIGVGTNLKFYIESGGAYNDITPIRSTVTINNNPCALTASTTVTVTDTAHGCYTGDFVTFSGATDIGGGGTNVTAAVLNQNFQVTVIDSNTYTIVISVTPNATAIAASPGGGAAVIAAYEIHTGPAFAVAVTGWGGGAWGSGTWGFGTNSVNAIQLWSQNNFGEDLIYAPRGGGIYYWSAQIGVTPLTFTVTIASPAVVTAALRNGTAVSLNTTGALPTGLSVGVVYYVVGSTGTTCNLSLTFGGAAITTTGTQSGTQTISPRGIDITQLGGASDCPTVQNFIFVADTSRFVFAFGCNDYGSTVQDPMLLRWSDQESVTNWTPSATNQAGSIRLSHGSEIVTCVQTRQEIVVWTDSSLYSLQYQGPPSVWSSQLLGDNISIIGPNAAVIASGVIYWMGVEKFYKYDGRTQTLRCDLRQHIFQDINLSQAAQVFAGTNEGFNEVWWFYCSQNSTAIDLYVTYNYQEDVWAYGTLGRTAWLDSGLRDHPIAATYSYNLVDHESGNDDNVSGTPVAINAVIGSAEFDIDDGDHFGFVWRMLPDITFRGSNAATPQVTMTLIPMQNSGSGYNNPISLGGNPDATVTRTSTSVIEQFTGQVYVRVRGRQMILQVESTQLGCAWLLGSPRFDIKQDGCRGISCLFFLSLRLIRLPRLTCRCLHLSMTGNILTS